MSKIEQRQNAQFGGKEKEIYFIILRPVDKKVNLDIKFSPEYAPQRIYKRYFEKGKDSFLEYNVFKLNITKKSDEKDKNDYRIKYLEGDYVYEILFSVKENTFVYDTELKKHNI